MKSNFLSILTITALAAAISGCAALEGMAQRGKVSSALNFVESGNLQKAKEAVEEAMEHEKTKDWPKTYYAMGRVAQTMWEKGYQDEDEKLMNTYDDQLVYAYDSYLKSMELDDKSSMEKMVIIQLPALANDFLTWAAMEFERENYDKSTLAFEKLLDIQGSDIYMGTVDTVVVFNTALAAYNAKDYEKAHKYLDQSIDLKYGEITPYLLKYQAYLEQGKIENAETALRNAFEAYPEDEQILLTMIQFFIDNDKRQEALDYLNLALEDAPDNYNLHYAKGVMHMQSEDYDKALESMLKSIELEDEYFNSQYNAGVCYYNKGANMLQAANEIMDPAEYNKAFEEAKEVFAKAIPYMEKARELNPDDMDTLTSLKELYYRLQMTDKYDEVVAKIKELEGGE
ncbi:MAG TPA: tetratricopeptide repeat protein [Bacteroidetes bacterium]|nr:tetratricopeptide repeat protein [Bacteroidota bacterium]